MTPAWARIEDLFDKHAESFDRLGIVAGVLLALISSTVFVIEPVFYWPGPQTIWYEGMLDAAELKKFRQHVENPEVVDKIVAVREELNDLFNELNAMHMQVGKKYRYTKGIDGPTLALVQGIKSLVDPERLMNPGTLGLD